MSLICFLLASTLHVGVVRADLGGLLRTGGHPSHGGFGGTTMERTFTMYYELPVGEEELAAKGWTKHTTKGCDPRFGYVWTEDPAGPTKSSPLKLYTTAGGQAAGVGIVILGYSGQDPLPYPQSLVQTVDPTIQFHGDEENAHLDVAFRSGDILCSGGMSDDVIGDSLTLNPKKESNAGGSLQVTLPVAEAEAANSGWKRGSCFDGMGWHWFKDVESPGVSWKADNLLPVVAMYHKGQINAIFFASTVNQVSIPMIATNQWEPMALDNNAMCMNFCDKDCTFSGLTEAGPWSTAHIYFRDHNDVTCDSELECAVEWPFRLSCCSKSGDVVV